MVNRKRSLQKCLKHNLTNYIALSLLLLMPTTALANGNNNNSDDPPPQTRGTSGGSRGCETESEASSSSIPNIILLAPTQSYGQTLANSPTFAWFVKDTSSWQMEFRLYEYNQATKQSRLVKEIKDENFKSSPGIMILSLPSQELLVGRRYLWQVELVCDANRPSGNPFAIAAMKVVLTPPEVKNQLSQSNDVLKVANLYKKADLWYKTVEIALSSNNEPTLKELRKSILEQVATGTQTELREQTKAALTNSTIHQLQR
ncbi:DUF928 domain-containing protein [Nostoc flagelliforme FACHB-838]|uniref:DUF928 domain-containing protein n=1 Tax=Nostoc flagelliforme FACHB-838 TaxID=2692904 RepID=A0ABR8E6L9_9NOSO|nr:DUF928 domain-containing protein [Nostoc flagelliforme]MBD2536278.1 DUF928 domain-containing protein [Nostoc flagelliforme FACHB-838]